MSEQKSTTSTWMKVAKRVFYTYIILNILIWIFSPLVTKYYLSTYLQDNYHLELSPESHIRFNPFTHHWLIEELVVEKEGVEVLTIGRLDLELRIHRLVALQLYVSELDINGLSALTEFTDEGVIFAGINLEEIKNSIETDAKIVEELEETIDLTILIPKISISSSGIKIIQNDANHSFSVDHFDINNISLSNAQNLLKSSFKGKINSADLNFNLEIDLQESLGVIKSNIELTDFNLVDFKQFLPKGISELDGFMSIKNSNTITLSPESIEIITNDLEIENKDLSFSKDTLNFKQQSLNLIVDGLITKIVNDEKIIQLNTISMIGSEVDLRDAGIEFKHDGQELTATDLNLKQNSDSTLNLLVDNFKVKSKGLRFDSKTMDFTQEDLSLSLDKISFNEKNQAQIQRIGLDRLNGVIQIKPGKINQEPDSESISITSESAKSSNEINDKTDEIGLIINKIEFTNSENIEFNDRSINPNYKRTLTFETFEINKLDSKQSEEPSSFIIKGHSDKYSKFNFKGYIKPFTKHVNLKLAGSLNEISLPPANGYIQQAMGFQFKHGELDTAIDVEIKDSDISGNTEVKIRGLEMDSTENYDQDAIQEQTALPLNVALGMLKDGDDNVVLDIPMLGNVESPSFGVSSFIGLVTKNAIQSAAKSYLIKTFIPYAELLSVTISAGTFIMKTRFEDLPYKPQQINISPEQSDYMTQFISLMKDKPETQVKACAISTIDELTDEEKASLEQSKKIVVLEKLSKARMDAFKESAVNADIESSRILLCSPKVDLNEGSKPILTLSI